MTLATSLDFLDRWFDVSPVIVKKVPLSGACASFWTAPVLWRFPPKWEVPKLRRNNVTMEKRHIQAFALLTWCPFHNPKSGGGPPQSKTRSGLGGHRRFDISRDREKAPRSEACASFWTAPVLWRFPLKWEAFKLRRNSVRAKKRHIQEKRHIQASLNRLRAPFTTPKAAEDRRSPKREAVSGVAHGSTPHA
jgi:hypothetical protein